MLFVFGAVLGVLHFFSYMTLHITKKIKLKDLTDDELAGIIFSIGTFFYNVNFLYTFDQYYTILLIIAISLYFIWVLSTLLKNSEYLIIFELWRISHKFLRNYAVFAWLALTCLIFIF